MHICGVYTKLKCEIQPRTCADIRVKFPARASSVQAVIMQLKLAAHKRLPSTSACAQEESVVLEKAAS